ncbi:MAG: hypothetical protein JW934_24260 [Anaerolineae bacterium]|nr:hypothetical protein [Anaerolineae bacterium]
MPTSHQAFDAHLETWKREMATPWSRICLKVEIANLLRHCTVGTIRVCAVGRVSLQVTGAILSGDRSKGLTGYQI